jgi:hypothetical protein
VRRVGTIIVLTATLAVSFSSAALAVSDTDNATTQVVVDASITLTGIPASIDFGNGVPGDVKNAPAITAKVTTNNLLGYSLNVTTSALTGATAANSYTIGAGRINYAVTTSVTGSASGTWTVYGMEIDSPHASVSERRSSYVPPRA